MKYLGMHQYGFNTNDQKSVFANKDKRQFRNVFNCHRSWRKAVPKIDHLSYKSTLKLDRRSGDFERVDWHTTKELRMPWAFLLLVFGILEWLSINWVWNECLRKGSWKMPFYERPLNLGLTPTFPSVYIESPMFSWLRKGRFIAF